MRATLIFMVPFRAKLTWNDTQQLGELLSLRIKRTDDWDDQVGSRLVGATGAIRLYRLGTANSEHEAQYYELRGTAVDAESKRQVASEYERCYRAVRSVGGAIDDNRMLALDRESPA